MKEETSAKNKSFHFFNANQSTLEAFEKQRFDQPGLKIADKHLVMNGLSQVVAAIGLDKEVPAIFLVADYLREALGNNLSTHISIEQEALMFRAYAALTAHTLSVDIQADFQPPPVEWKGLAPRHVACDVLGTLISAFPPNSPPTQMTCTLWVETSIRPAAHLDVTLKSASFHQLGACVDSAMSPLVRAGILPSLPKVVPLATGHTDGLLVSACWPVLADD